MKSVSWHLMPNLDLSAESVSKEGPQKKEKAIIVIHVDALFLHELKVQPVFKTMG